MGKLIVTCSRCGMTTSLRDNGYENPFQVTRCPFCEIGELRREPRPAPLPKRPSEAA
jgi:hypothetical protein